VSFILDALRRSDRTRRLLDAGRAPEPVAVPAARRAPPWLAWGAALVALNLALLAWWAWRGPSDAPPPDPAPAAAVRSLAREAGGPAASSLPPGVAELAAGDLGAASPPLAPSELPPELRARFPDLHLDAHAWSEDPAQRFVVIGLKRRVVGDALDGGAVLAEITADGAVVRFADRLVFLARQ